MNDQSVGRSFRGVRVRRGRRQSDVARDAGVSRWTVARIERGRLEEISLVTLRCVARALDISLEIAVRWQGAELDRILGAGHDALREAVIRLLADTGPWEVAAEVTFSRWGERGAIDLLAWHPASRTLLVVEVKSEIVEAGRLIAQVDRYRRLAPDIVRPRGWFPARVATWVVVVDSRTNRRRVADNRAALRNSYPDDGRVLRGWLGNPSRPLSALSFMPDERAAHLTRGSDRQRRVRIRAAPSA
jgi:transcriptional regulator with XRE-family HTH domain